METVQPVVTEPVGRAVRLRATSSGLNAEAPAQRGIRSDCKVVHHLEIEGRKGSWISGCVCRVVSRTEICGAFEGTWYSGWSLRKCQSFKYSTAAELLACPPSSIQRSPPPSGDTESSSPGHCDHESCCLLPATAELVLEAGRATRQRHQAKYFDKQPLHWRLQPSHCLHTPRQGAVYYCQRCWKRCSHPRARQLTARV